MVMQWRHGNIYGVDANGAPRTDHAPAAAAIRNQNEGSSVGEHRIDYGFAQMDYLRHHDINGWRDAIRTYGPIIAEGKYGWARIGWGEHTIVIVGVSTSGEIAYFNPNLFGVLPHPSSKLSYMPLARLMEHADAEGAFWACRA
jgi:hypothetical protein